MVGELNCGKTIGVIWSLWPPKFLIFILLPLKRELPLLSVGLETNKLGTWGLEDLSLTENWEFGKVDCLPK